MTTTTPMRTVSEDEFLQAVQRVCEANPDRTNPRSNRGCRYEFAGQNCLIGHTLVHEFQVPYDRAWEDKNAGDVLRLLLASDVLDATDAASAADDLQLCADCGGEDDQPLEWGQVWYDWVMASEEDR